MSDGGDHEARRRHAVWEATKAVRKILATAKNPRTLLHGYRPTALAYHAAWAAIEAYEAAAGQDREDRE